MEEFSRHFLPRICLQIFRSTRYMYLRHTLKLKLLWVPTASFSSLCVQEEYFVCFDLSSHQISLGQRCFRRQNTSKEFKKWQGNSKFLDYVRPLTYAWSTVTKIGKLIDFAITKVLDVVRTCKTKPGLSLSYSIDMCLWLKLAHTKNLSRWIVIESSNFVIAFVIEK